MRSAILQSHLSVRHEPARRLSCQRNKSRKDQTAKPLWTKLRDFYPRDAMLARVIAIAKCLSVRLSRAGIVSKRRKLAA